MEILPGPDTKSRNLKFTEYERFIIKSAFADLLIRGATDGSLIGKPESQEVAIARIVLSPLKPDDPSYASETWPQMVSTHGTTAVVARVVTDFLFANPCHGSGPAGELVSGLLDAVQEMELAESSGMETLSAEEVDALVKRFAASLDSNE